MIYGGRRRRNGGDRRGQRRGGGAVDITANRVHGKGGISRTRDAQTRWRNAATAGRGHGMPGGDSITRTNSAAWAWLPGSGSIGKRLPQTYGDSSGRRALQATVAGISGRRVNVGGGGQALPIPLSSGGGRKDAILPALEGLDEETATQ